MQFKAPGTEGMSRSEPIIRTLDRLDAAFPGGSVPATTVIKADDVTTPEVQAAIKALHDQAIATGRLSRALGVEISPDKTVAIVVAVRSRARAPTPPPTTRSRSCASRSCRPRSASSRTPRSR